MSVVVAGINHNTASVDIRERVALVPSELQQALGILRTHVNGGAIMSTCNRTEIYASSENPDQGLDQIMAFLSDYQTMPIEELKPYLYKYTDEQAFRHLFSVAAGIDSMILGETEILGQVKDALSAATIANSIDMILTRLFQHALKTGRAARNKTDISHHAASVSSAAVQMARGVFGGLENCQVLVISAGQAGKLAAKCLKDAGAKGIGVANRSISKASKLSKELDAELVTFTEIPKALNYYDIVISATASNQFVLHSAAIAQTMQQRENKPMCLIDIAVPRNIDPESRKVPHVHLFDIDDLKAISSSNQILRRNAVSHVKTIIDREVETFSAWIKGLSVSELIASLTDEAESIRLQEFEKAMRRLSHLSERDKSQVQILTRAITAKLLHKPIASIKNSASQSQAKLFQDMVQNSEAESTE